MKKTFADYWAPRINAEWRKSVECIVNVGRQLMAAKEACEHGEFMRLFKGSDNAVSEPVPFGIHTADRLMAIAAKPAIADCAHAHTLPQSWATLYELTKLDDAEITARVEAGEITPEMTRSQAAALRADPIERPQRELCVVVWEAFTSVYAKYSWKLDSHSRRYVIERLHSMLLLLEEEQRDDVGNASGAAAATPASIEPVAVQLFNAMNAAVRAETVHAEYAATLHERWLELAETLFSDFPLCRVRAPWCEARTSDAIRDAAAFAAGVQGRPAKVFRQLNAVARRIVRLMEPQSAFSCPS